MGQTCGLNCYYNKSGLKEKLKRNKKIKLIKINYGGIKNGDYLKRKNVGSLL